MNLYSFIFESIPLLIQLYSDKYRQDDLEMTLNQLENDDNLPRIKIYDFIVVGGGTAGCVIASRLSKQYKVLLLETGGNPVPAVGVPAFYPDVGSHPAINFIYNSKEEQRTGTGKMLGGTSSHNDVIHNRGHPLNFDDWANITNDNSWRYQNVLKYFKKSEHFIGVGKRKEHGYKGLMTIDTNETPMLPTWLDAGEELGFKTTLDPNGPQMESFSGFAIARKKGHRVSTYTAFIHPFENKRETLHIERYSVVTEILINKKKKAYGVAYLRHQIPQIAHASKEIIISCGVFETPILLMKSGIGPSNWLHEAGIPVVADLPVGKGLQVHYGVGFYDFSFRDNSLFPSIGKELTEDSLREYHKRGEGILKERVLGTQAFAVSSWTKRYGQPNFPDIHMYFTDGLNTGIPSYEYLIGFSIRVSRPLSSGTVKLNSTAYTAGISGESLVVIDYNVLSNPNDIGRLVEGIKLALTIAENTTAFQQLGAQYIGKPYPKCNRFKFRTDEYWQSYIRYVVSIFPHIVSGCKMGYGLLDKDAVLDSKLNVLGISRLKVVDGSVMPRITNANTMAPIIMIAEKASAEILKRWKSKLSIPY